MSNPKDETFYDNQVERYLSQILRAFSGFKVKDGVSRGGAIYEETVPVIFGSPSRVVAAILSRDNDFKNIKVPIMAVGITGIELDDESRLNPYHETEVGYKRSLDATKVNVRRIAGVPLRISIDLNIYASSVTQLMELFQKILLTFHPEVTIQKSTNVFDPDYITSIKMEGISSEISRPLGQNHRTVEMTLQFSVPVRISYPYKEADTLDEIRLKVFDEDSEMLVSDDVINIDTKDITTPE